MSAHAPMLRAPFPWFGNATDQASQKVAARFWSKVDINGPNGCWLWTASKRNKGYGAFAFKRDGVTVNGRAHRISYEIHHGAIPGGQVVCHRCDTPACLNPAHLFIGTKAENNADMIQKGRQVKGGSYGRDGYERGEGHHAATLTADDVRAIRAEHAAGGTSYAKLASKYGLAIGHVHRIVSRKAWAHVQ